MFRFETQIARVSRAMAKIVNQEAWHKGRRHRVHDLIRGSLDFSQPQHPESPPSTLHERSQ